MRIAVASAAVFGVAAAQWGPAGAPNATASDVYVTEVVTAFTTYCPEATQFSHAGSTYTVSQATTLTITNCPGGCTITRPSYSSSTPAAPASYSSVSSSVVAPVAPVPYTSASASAPASSPVAPVPYSSAPVVAPYPSSNGTTAVSPVGTAASSGTSSSTSTSSPVPYTGAANKVSVAGVGLLALFGLVAAL